MIAFLQGKIEYKNEKFIIIETANIGYQIFCSMKTLEKIEIGQEIKFFTHLCLKKEAIELYGFITLKELELFKRLNNISGIGVKTALNLASFGSLEKLKEMIGSQKFLPELKGIGKKRLQKIILEISEISNAVSNMEEKQFTPEQESVLEALISLGFSVQKAKQAIKQIPEEIKETEEKIKECLKFLQGK